MAYATSNPPALTTSGLGGFANQWTYKSADAAALVRVSGYFTNGYDLGMRAGDLLLQVDTDATPITMQMMIVTSAVVGTVDLSDGTAIVATDTD